MLRSNFSKIKLGRIVGGRIFELSLKVLLRKILNNMNKTNSLKCFELEKPSDRSEAQIYLKNKYSSIIYDSITDSYELKGEKFDYFKSGLMFTVPSSHSYMLISKEYNDLWLFTYGTDDEMWEQYLKNKENLKSLKKLENHKWWQIWI